LKAQQLPTFCSGTLKLILLPLLLALLLPLLLLLLGMLDDEDYGLKPRLGILAAEEVKV
jgi:hypothetical protein